MSRESASTAFHVLYQVAQILCVQALLVKNQLDRIRYVHGANLEAADLSPLRQIYCPIKRLRLEVNHGLV